MTVSFQKFQDATIDGALIDNIISLTVDSIKPVQEIINKLETPYPTAETMRTDANGTIRLKAKYDANGNSPQELLDTVGRLFGHTEYDTVNARVDVVTDTYNGASVSAGYAEPARTVEVRSIATTADSTDVKILDGTSTRWVAIPFVAGGTDIREIALLAKETAGGDVDTFTAEIWSNTAGSPNAKLASTDRITVYFAAGADDATKYYYGGDLGTSLAWITIDMSDNLPNIMGTATLTPGTLYWLVLGQAVTAANKAMFLANDEGTKTYYPGTNNVWVKYSDNDGGAWSSFSTVYNVTFIMQFYTTDGHQIEVFNYSDAARTTGTHYTFSKVTFTDDQGHMFDPSKVTEQELKWKSQNVTIAAI